MAEEETREVVQEERIKIQTTAVVLKVERKKSRRASSRPSEDIGEWLKRGS